MAKKQKIEPFTERKSPATGKPYPRCQFVSRREQCQRTAYADGLCWGHYRQDAPSVAPEIGSIDETWALETAARAWCDPSTAHLTMSVELCRVFAGILSRSAHPFDRTDGPAVITYGSSKVALRPDKKRPPRR